MNRTHQHAFGWLSSSCVSGPFQPFPQSCGEFTYNTCCVHISSVPWCGQVSPQGVSEACACSQLRKSARPPPSPNCLRVLWRPNRVRSVNVRLCGSGRRQELVYFLLLYCVLALLLNVSSVVYEY